jgi:uncharacterized protein (DUF1684 family)
MKTTNLIILLAVVAVLGVVFYSLTGTDETEYIAAIENERKEKNEFMKTGEGSPFEGQEESFHGLNYFPPAPKFRVQADLEPVADRKMRVLPTSDGKEKRYMEYAYATFRLEGVLNKLLLLEIVDPGAYKGTLFLAFADATSAIDTYGAGRYLDIKKVPGASTILLDFNKAYNPYCAYSDKFSCPFPPKENVLSIAILAGEKTYEEH